MVISQSVRCARKEMIAALFLAISFYINSYFLTQEAEQRVTYKAYHISADIQSHLTGGYDYALSVLQWFYTISEFGGKVGKERPYIDIAERLDTITRLNPYAVHAYYMAATMLPWGMQSTKMSHPLLERAMQKMPHKWQWPYYQGFNAYWFDDNIDAAAKYMTRSAQLSDSPPIVASLAARMRSERGDLDTALDFLYNLLQNKQDIALKKQLERQIKKIQTEKTLRRIDRRLVQLPESERNESGLYKLGIRTHESLPDGGHIIFNTEGIPVSSASGKRYQVFSPPKRTKKKIK